MKNRIVTAVASLLLLLPTISCSSSSASTANPPTGGIQQETANPADPEQAKDQLTTEQKLEDFEYLYQIVKENFPFLKVNQRVSGIDWLANKAKYQKRIERTKDDLSFKRTLRTIMVELNNGHSNLISFEDYAYFKKLYTNTKENATIHKPWLDVLNQPVSKARYATSESTSLDSQMEQLISLPAAVTTEIISKDVAYLKIPTLDTFQIEPDMKVIKPFLQKVRNYQTLIIDIRGNGGGDDSYWSWHLVPMLISKPISYHTYTLFRGGTYSIPFIEAKLERKFSDLEAIPKIELKSSSSLAPEIMTDFQRYVKVNNTITPKDSINFKGEIYLLVDQSIYSSSEAWAVFAEQTKWATLVGSRTGGDGIGFEPILLSLPNSGYILRLPIALGLKADGFIDDEVKVTPSIVVTDPPQEPLAKDPAVQAVLKAEAERLKK